MTKEELIRYGVDLKKLSNIDYDFIDEIEDAETEKSYNDDWEKYWIERHLRQEREYFFGTDKCFLTEKYVWSLTPSDEDYYKNFCLLTNSQGHTINKCLIDYYLKMNDPLRGHKKVEPWLNETYHLITCMISDKDWLFNNVSINEEAKVKLIDEAAQEEFTRIPVDVQNDVEIQKKITLDYYKSIIDLWYEHYYPRPIEKHLDQLLCYGFKISIYEAFDYLYTKSEKKHSIQLPNN